MKQTPPYYLKFGRTLPQFNQVNVSGVIDVQVHTDFSKSSLILQGDSRDLAHVKAEVLKNQVLVIHVDNGYPRFGKVNADIRMQDLNSFSYKGRGLVQCLALHSRLLDIEIDNAYKTTLSGNIYLRRLLVRGGGYTEISGARSTDLLLSLQGKTKLLLVGTFNISTINLSGDSVLTMYWVNSSNLHVRGKGNALIKLAGVVNRLDVELTDCAYFNGRYLRAGRAFVKTCARAKAEVSALEHQHTLAEGASNIYFYNLPAMKTDFMAYNGSVLDLRAWNEAGTLHDYNRYNN